MKRPVLGILSVFFLLFFSSCGREDKQETTAIADLAVEDSSTSANQRSVITISEANTDLEGVENIKRPATSEVANSKFLLSSLYVIWTYDPEGPHADFKLNEKWFYVVDYDGNGNMPYIIKRDSIIVFYNDFISKGIIKEATGESLKISWDGQEATEYVRWTP